MAGEPITLEEFRQIPYVRSQIREPAGEILHPVESRIAFEEAFGEVPG